MVSEIKVGMHVHVRFPDDRSLDGAGIIIAELRPGDGRHLFQVDMGDHDNWVPAEWVSAKE